MKKEYLESKDFPVFKDYDVSNLIHVGDMDLKKKQPHSHEGKGLSVSICPYHWSKIARGCMASNNAFCFSKDDVMLLDFYNISENGKNEIINWAHNNGYVIFKNRFMFKYYDDEFESNISGYSLTLEDALYEVGFNIDEWNELNSSDKLEYIQEVNIPVPTNKLNLEIGWKVSDEYTYDIVVTLYSEYILKYDGVYWNEMLDVGRLSAPRGVLFNSVLERFCIKKYKLYSNELNEILPDTDELFGDYF